MRFTQVLACCSVLVLCSHGGTALKCRTSEHQSNDQFQMVMQRCRARIFQDNKGMTDQHSAPEDDADDDDSYDDDDSSDSDEKDSDKKFSNGRTGSTNSSLTRNSRSNNNGDDNRNSRRYEQNSSSRPYPYNYKTMNNASSTRTDFANDRLSRNTTSRNGGPNSNYGQNDMQSNQRDQAIDEDGFPEKSAVSKIMTQNIRDRELQNFIEEAVMGCFYMINAIKNKEQCKFSQNLLNCLATKGREKCEDWDHQ